MGAMLSAGSATADEAPLHERIDALIDAATLGPVAAIASDADFLRRAYLDLNGTIPDAATARAFLDDPAPGKRPALVDRLLSRPQFARHMQRVFDVMLMERRPQKTLPAAEWNVSAAEWQEYLRKSFADNKPLDQLVREILAADGVDPQLRPAAKFYLDREGDANLLTRDVGRLFFGRDMQCAQCHDHPLVDDYLQADYYGLMAFVSRGVLFNSTPEKKVYYAENADGEVNYKSVFTGDARDRVAPKLPHGQSVSEPLLNKDEQYVVAPAKEVRGVPKYSRRAQLAAGAASGASAAFNRNLANRLWAQMMGRGLVHPLDLEHSGNPAVHSPLLALVTDELVRMKFDAKAFLRELTLTRAYQRSSTTPPAEELKLDPAAVAQNIAAWNVEVQRLSGEIPPLETSSNASIVELNAAYERFSKSAGARDAVEKTRAEAKKAVDDIAAALAADLKSVAEKEDILRSLVEANKSAQAAAAKLPGDKAIADAAAQFKTRANEIDTQLAGVRKTAGEKSPQVQAASLRLAETDKALQAAVAEVAPFRTALDAAEGKSRQALQQFRTAKALHREWTLRIADAQAALDCQALVAAANAAQAAAVTASEQLTALKSQTALTAEQLPAGEAAAKAAAEKATADRARAAQAFEPLADRATARFVLAPLKPLSPEQLAFATMQVVGQVEAQRAALEPQAQKDVEAMQGLSPEARAAQQERLLEERIDEKLRGHLAPFVPLFGQQPGQAPTFQATVHQALFLANGGLLAGWLNPGGNNLTERLTKIEDPAALAEELYLSVLTRRPTADEQALVAAYWVAAKADRAAAARDMVWSLLASAEFRFNH
jgi:hypothetical protein